MMDPIVTQIVLLGVGAALSALVAILGFIGARIFSSFDKITVKMESDGAKIVASMDTINEKLVTADRFMRTQLHMIDMRITHIEQHIWPNYPQAQRQSGEGIAVLNTETTIRT